MTLEPNEFGWNRNNGLLVLDQPLGTGYSDTPAADAPVNTEAQVAADVFVALQGFFHRHPHFRQRPFFIAGESFAGAGLGRALRSGRLCFPTGNSLLSEAGAALLSLLVVVSSFPRLISRANPTRLFSLPRPGKYIPSVAPYILKQKQAHQREFSATNNRPVVSGGASAAYSRRLLGAGADLSAAAAGGDTSLFSSAARWLAGCFSSSSSPSSPQQQQQPEQQSAAVPARSVDQLAADPPYFDLRGVLIGNGYTDPKNQTLWVAPTAFAFGLIDEEERDAANEVAALARALPLRLSTDLLCSPH